MLKTINNKKVYVGRKVSFENLFGMLPHIFQLLGMTKLNRNVYTKKDLKIVLYKEDTSVFIEVNNSTLIFTELDYSILAPNFYDKVYYDDLTNLINVVLDFIRNSYFNTHSQNH